MDGIYQRQGKKVDFIIKQRRLRIRQGKPESFSIVYERIQDIEKSVIADLNIKKQLSSLNSVADVRNKAVLTDNRKVMLEKLKGRFDLKLNQNLSMDTKINMFSNEGVIFHLHKNRNFIEKIQKPPE